MEKLCEKCGKRKAVSRGLCKNCYSSKWARGDIETRTPKIPDGRCNFGLSGDDVEVLKSLAKQYKVTTYNIMAKVILEKVLYKMPEKQFKKLMED